MIDNHTHLDLINDKLVNIINRANRAGVTGFIVPGICGFPKKLDELQKYSEVKLCWGIYPQFAENDNIIEKEIENLEKSLIKIVAIGECGLDRRFPNIDKQIILFKKQIDIATKLSLPLIVHLVGYWQKAFDILKNTVHRPEFIMHSWNGSVEMAKEFIKIGGKISLSASALKKPDKLKELLKSITHDKIIFETDSPDQKPDFVDTAQNEPANLPLIVEKIKQYQ
jgi:TatD DNase family protein